MNESFSRPQLSKKTLDTYIVRKGILDAILMASKQFKGRLLDIGCGQMPYKTFIEMNSSIVDYIGLDILSELGYAQEIKPDLLWDGITIPVEDGTFDTAIATEVLEHCPEPLIVMKEAYRVLSDRGVFMLTVPFLWNLHDVPHDEFRFTPFSLRRLLSGAGFREIEVGAMNGWHGSMAQMIGMWVNRSPLSPSKRRILQILSQPLIKMLLRKDQGLIIKFGEGQMINSLYAIAKK